MWSATRERARERFLSQEETERLGAVLREAEPEIPVAVAAFRLLLLTGCRLSEIQTLRWDYVKDDCIELPDAKTGGRAVPLGPEARAVPLRTGSARGAGQAASHRQQSLGHRRQAAGHASHRLPAAVAAHPRTRWAGIRANSRRLPLVRLEGARAGRESLTMNGKLLGHTQVQTTARYARLARDSVQNAAARITESIGENLMIENNLTKPDNKFRINHGICSCVFCQGGLSRMRNTVYFAKTAGFLG